MGDRETAAAYARILHRQMKEAVNGMVRDGYGREGAMMVIMSTMARLFFEEGLGSWRKMFEMMSSQDEAA